MVLLATLLEPYNVSSRKMFGSLTYFINGNMLTGVHEDIIFLRLSVEDQEEIKKEFPCVDQFDPLEGRKMREYIVLDEEIYRIETESRLLSEKEIERGRLVREAELNRKNYILYQDKREEARITEQRDVSRVANVYVASWAYRPSVPIFPKKIKIGLISMIVGLIIGIGSAFTAFYLDHTIKSPEDLDRHCQIKMLSSLQKIDAH